MKYKSTVGPNRWNSNIVYSLHSLELCVPMTGVSCVVMTV
jgi:hypothetical protein